MVTDLHLNAIVSYAAAHVHDVFVDNEWIVVEGNEQLIIDMLETANRKAVSFKLGDDEVAGGVEYRPTDNHQSPMQIIKLCRCFNYQACEVDDYPGTSAAVVINTILHAAICNLPGYDDLKWFV
jgi:hypothetical protein